MPEYRRARQPGGMSLFTIVTNRRRRLFANEQNVRLLGEAMRHVRAAQPFEVPGVVVLPEHVHMLMQLPADDGDFSTRIGRIKSAFTRSLSATAGGTGNDSRRRQGERAIWQRRFWEHMIRDEEDFERHLEYILYNPVRHGHVTCPHFWRWTSFHLLVQRGGLPARVGVSV